MIDAREANVFEVQILDAFDGFTAADVTTLVRIQQLSQFSYIHLCVDSSIRFRKGPLARRRGGK